MDIKQLSLEIKILRLLKPIADEAHLSLDKIANHLGEINSISELNNKEEWKEFKSNTYTYLKKIKRVSDDYEAYKKRLIAKYYPKNEHIILDKNTKIKFNKNANVLIIYGNSDKPEVL